MNSWHILLAAALAVTATQAQAQGFSDTSVGIRDSMFVANPGGNPGSEKGSRDVNKVIFNVSHFDVWDYGSNFFSVDMLLSNPNEAANNSAGGSTEFYAIYRGQLSPDKIAGINTKIGPFSAINLEAGGDLESENTYLAPNKKAIVIGPNFHLDLPDRGFLTIGVHLYHEWNHNSFLTPTSQNYSSTGEFEFVWLYPLKFTGLPLDFRGFTNVILPKGNGGSGAGNTTYTEVLSRPQLQLDLGTMLWNKPHKPDIYLAVELWEHKFGLPSKLAGTEEVAPTIGMEVHF